MISGGESVIADDDGIVELPLPGERRYGFPSIFVERHAEDSETAGLVLLLELHKPRDFDLAPAAGRRPEIEEDYLAFVFGEFGKMQEAGFPRISGRAGRGQAENDQSERQ